MTTTQQKSPSAPEIETWLIAHVSAAMKIAPQKVDAQKPFEQFGMGSLESVNLISELETWLGRSLDATLVWDYPTIKALAAHLAKG